MHAFGEPGARDHAAQLVHEIAGFHPAREPDAERQPGIAQPRRGGDEVEVPFGPHDPGRQQNHRRGRSGRHRRGPVAPEKPGVDPVGQVAKTSAQVGGHVEAVDPCHAVGQRGVLADGKVQVASVLGMVLQRERNPVPPGFRDDLVRVAAAEEVQHAEVHRMPREHPSRLASRADDLSGAARQWMAQDQPFEPRRPDQRVVEHQVAEPFLQAAGVRLLVRCQLDAFALGQWQRHEHQLSAPARDGAFLQARAVRGDVEPQDGHGVAFEQHAVEVFEQAFHATAGFERVRETQQGKTVQRAAPRRDSRFR